MVPGPQGPQGLPGASGSVYVHEQTTPASNWIVTHNLTHYVSATILPTGETQSVVADIFQNSLNSATIVFPSPVSGTAVFF